MDRPGQQEATVTTPVLPPAGGRVRLDERSVVSPGVQSAPGGWGQPPPQVMFGRGELHLSYHYWSIEKFMHMPLL